MSYSFTPQEIIKQENGRLLVRAREKNGDKIIEDVYDTVIYATGRKPDTEVLNLESIGLKTVKGEFEVKNEQTMIDWVYAIGDIAWVRQFPYVCYPFCVVQEVKNEYFISMA